MELVEKYLGEKGGRNKMARYHDPEDVKKASDEKLIAFAKKLNKTVDVDANVWNMVVDELKKRKLKF
jgi:hypothetical protein